MACSSSCPTQDHTTYGECMRSKNIHAADVAYAAANQKHTKELTSYQAARKQGIQPRSTRARDIDAAVRISEQTGTAYRAEQ